MKIKKTKLLLYSRLALYPMHWEAFKVICSRYDVEASVIVTNYCDLPEGHQMLGSVDINKEKISGFSPKIYNIPQSSIIKKVLLIFKYLREIKPDIVWAQEEPVTLFLFPLLVYYFFKRKSPRIVIGLAENIFDYSIIKRLIYNILWRRIDVILSVANVSTKSIQKNGMPKSVKVYDLVAGCLSPEENILPMNMPIQTNKNDFIVGFVGRIIEEKGWKVVMHAIKQAPSNFKFAIAGSGNQIEELKEYMNNPKLKERIYYAGLLPKKELWRFYKAIDCLTVPSLTTKTWKEQFGGILADAMAMGIPIVGSDSGAVPEVTGPAGIIVPENNPDKLLEALIRLQSSPEIRRTLGENGKRRFKEEFCIEAYARKIAIGLNLKQ